MDLDKIQVIMKGFENSDMRELKLDEGNFHLYLSKNRNNQVQTKGSASVQETKEKLGQAQASSKTVKAPINKAKKEKLAAVKAPIVGIVYLQAKPGADPYVKVGDHIQKGQTVAIIEAMKMMTEIKSKVSGTVTKIDVENEDLVEVDQPLISVKED